MDQSNRSRLKTFFLQSAPILGTLLLIISVAGVLGPKLHKSTPKSPIVLAAEEMASIANAFKAYHRDMGEWPHVGAKKQTNQARVCAFLGSYQCLFKRKTSSIHWAGPYLKNRIVSTPEGLRVDETLVDPWGNGYQVYSFPAHHLPGENKESLSIVSPGPDGVLNTSMTLIAHGYPEGDDMVFKAKSR